MTAQLTKPFEVIHNEPSFVRNKFLEGEPYNGKLFPGPFQGLTQEQQAQYAQQQRTAVQNWHMIAEKPLQVQADLYPMFNKGLPNCESYGAEVKMFAPVEFQRSPGPDNAEGVLYSNNIVREPFDNVGDFHDESITNPCNQTGFGQIVPKFIELPEGVDAWTPNSSTSFMKCSAEDNPLLDIENRPVDQFSHNNMVPFYGSKLTQSMASTGVAQAGDNNTCKGVVDGFAETTPWRDKLQTFTGCDEMYMHKRETSPLFSPAEQQTGWVFGTPAFRPDLERYKEAVWRRNGETPVEKIQVGPGLALDYSVPAQGGFQQFTRILPNNVSDYKSNQLEARVAGGKWFTNHPTAQYIHGVSNDKPELYMTQARRPTMRTKFYTNSPSGGDSRITDYSTVVARGKQTRPDTEQGAGFGQFDLREFVYDGSGKLIEKFTTNPNSGMPCIDFGIAPVGRIMKSQVPMPTQDLQSFNNIRETFKRGEAKYDEKKGFVECLDSSQGANRWDIIMGPAQGGVPNQESRQGIYVNFTDRGDVNPYVINVTGTAQTGGQWSPNNFQDQQRVTTKETTQFAYSGNPSGSNMKNYINTWDDQQRVTTKETTQFAYSGNPSGSNMKTYINTWDDDPKVTRKETTQFSHANNPKGNIELTNRFMYEGSDFFPLNK